MFRSLRGSTAAKSAPPAPVHTPSAFSAKKAFAPPPVRRVSAAPVPEPEPEPEPEEAQEEEVVEWAEALYDFTGQVRAFFFLYIVVREWETLTFRNRLGWSLKEAGDLDIREGERVRVTEKTSADWYACPDSPC